jgi:hypothetical protein
LYIILLLILINGTGLLLKYYNLDRFVIIIGFRFHLSLLLPFLFLITQRKFAFIKQELKRFSVNNFIVHFIFVLIPLIVSAAVLFLCKYAELNDPDYFYEFGISSVVDLPLYFIWNLPQFLMIGLFLKYLTSNKKLNFIIGFAVIFSLFIYEFIPVHKEKFILFPAYNLAAVSILIALIIVKAKNIYSFAVAVFMFIWCNALLYGSENKSLINNLFAKNYSNWEGFLKLSKQIVNYYFVIQAILTIIFFLIYYIVSQRKIKS